MEIKQQITKLLNDLNKGVYEKQEVIALTLLTAVAGESIFLLGAPGVAKSLIARRLKFGFKDGTSFEYLMNRFSTPDEIFGPVSITKLKEDKYERVVKNYLPSASVVFLDEIWKAGPSIQNALLTVLNEKIYRNGDEVIDPIPLKALISASNELPGKDLGLEALWDRFLVRYEVYPMKSGTHDERERFNQMISNDGVSDKIQIEQSVKITDEQYRKMSEEIDKITVPENVYNVIHIIRSYIDQHNKKDEKQENQIYISDRRWKKIVRLLRTSAFLNDRKAVDLMDCFLISHCIWNEPTQFTTVLQFTKDAIQKHGYTLPIDLKDLRQEISEFEEEVKGGTSFLKDIQIEEAKPIEKKYYQIKGLNSNANYILISDFDNLNATEQYIYLYQKDTYYNNGFRQYSQFRVKKGKRFKVVLNGTEYSIETRMKDDKKKASKKPHHSTKKRWDNIVLNFTSMTEKLKEQIEQYRSKDLKHIRENMFVNSTLAEVVESHLSESQKRIVKLELDVAGIKHHYETVEDETAS